MPSIVGNPIANRDQQIADLAYHYWEEEGHPHGRDSDHWLRAATEVDKLSAASSEKKPKLKLVSSRSKKRA